MKPNKLSSEHIQNEVITLTYETSSSEYLFETKLQAKFDKSDQMFEQIEEELIDFIVKLHQESKCIEKYLVPIKSETLCPSEATGVLNEISLNFPSQFLVQERHISKTSVSFDENFKHISMNIRIEATNFEPEQTF